MKKTARLLSAAVLAAVVCVSGVGAADPSPVNPVNQPLVVLRAADAKLVESVLSTRQARALELDKKDFSGRIPGVDARIDSLKAFVAALGYGNGKNLWYCLSQQGSSLANQTGAMGWDAADEQPDADLPKVVEWLGQMGMDIRGLDLEMRRLDAGDARFIVSRDGDARKEITGGIGRADGGWRGGLASFMNGPRDSVGVWANTRPLLGLLSLLSGIDFRAKMNAHNMGSPVWAQVELFNNAGDLGFEARLNNILPKEIRNSDAAPVLIHGPAGALLELNFPAPGGIWEMLDINKDVFFLANINILAMIPRSINVNIRRNAAGAHAWDMVCLMPDKEKFIAQLKRVHSWLDVLSAASSSAFGIEETKSPWGDALWQVHIGELSLVMGVVAIDAAGADNAFLVMAPTVEDWPNPQDLKVTTGDAPCIVEWNANLDPESRSEIIRNLTELSRQRGAKDFTARFFDQFLPDKDSGRIGMEGDALVIRSDHGLLPLLAPDVIDMFKGGTTRQETQIRTVAARLRYLLDAASQARFHGLDVASRTPAALPESLADLAGDEVAAWIDSAYGAFPGLYGRASDIIADLGAGKALDGFRYRIDDPRDHWTLTAENGRGLSVSLDGDGTLSIARDGVEVGQREQLFSLPKLLNN